MLLFPFLYSQLSQSFYLPFFNFLISKKKREKKKSRLTRKKLTIEDETFSTAKFLLLLFPTYAGYKKKRNERNILNEVKIVNLLHIAIIFNDPTPSVPSSFRATSNTCRQTDNGDSLVLLTLWINNNRIQLTFSYRTLIFNNFLQHKVLMMTSLWSILFFLSASEQPFFSDMRISIGALWTVT